MKAKWKLSRPMAALAGSFLLTSTIHGQLSNTGSFALRQGQDGLPGASELNDRFGGALASGDFDGDGRDDLAIGAPWEGLGVSVAGQVTVVYAAVGGLDPATGDVWTLDATGFGPAAVADYFGEAIAAGNFDGDGYDDLAIGVPDRAVGAEADAGVVIVLYGGPGGLAFVGSQLLRQGLDDLQGVPEDGDSFGEELATGDLNGDGIDDLAIGVPGENVGLVVDAGAVNVIYGSASGLSAVSAPVLDQIFMQNFENNFYGKSLAIADFDDDGDDDLAIGVPSGDVGGFSGAGWVVVLRGSATGLSNADSTIVSLDGPVPGDPDTGAHLGTSLAAGDLDCDGFADLAVGIPGYDVPTGGPELTNAGAVILVRGAAPGLDVSTATMLDRGAATGAAVAEDNFGEALAIGDFDGGCADLIVGAPELDLPGIDDAGAAFLFSGAAAGPPAFAFTLTQDGAGPGLPEIADEVGAVLAVGDFDGNGFDDAVVGVPLDSAGGQNGAGEVDIFPSVGLFSDGFESGGVLRWSGADGE